MSPLAKNRNRPLTVWIIGAGYVGTALGHLLQEKQIRPVLWSRSPATSDARARAGFENTWSGDAADPAAWSRALERLPSPDALVFCASSGGGDLSAYEAVYGRALQTSLAHRPGSVPFIYTSSTSVYGQTDGSWVRETDPANGRSPTTPILLEAESRVIKAGGTVLRLAGIYGPGRGQILRGLLAGYLPSPDVPPRWINLIHRDDAAAAILHFLLVVPSAGEIFNVADGHPTQPQAMADWLIRHYKLRVPSPAPSRPPQRSTSRVPANRRIEISKITATGWRPSFPSYREGYASIPQSSFAENQNS